MTGTARRWLSPLRYPGGKARMAGFLGEVWDHQFGPMDIEVWLEPFAGGAGAGLALLDDDRVGEVWLVEKSPALAALWATIAAEPRRLADTVAGLRPDLGLWAAAKQTVAAAEAGVTVNRFQLGLAALVVNRCSRSGIVTAAAGPMGGKRQEGRWTVASRFNGDALADRIARIGDLAAAGRLRIHEGDGIGYIAELNDSGFGDEVLAFVDPPYIAEGNRLYSNGMTAADHRRLADALNGCDTPWLLTYDAHPLVEDLYSDRRILAFQIPHTANRQRVDWEYAVLSDNLAAPRDVPLLPRSTSRWVSPAA